jgi:hypothetical protein
MKWDAIGAVGEVLGALGVFASLVYLAMQIRQNTRMMKATIRQQLTAASQQVVFENGRVADVLVKVAAGPELTPTDRLRVAALARATFRGYENYAYQPDHGLFDDSEWLGLLQTMRSGMAIPMVREEWAAMRNEYSERLQRVLDEATRESESAR